MSFGQVKTNFYLCKPKISSSSTCPQDQFTCYYQSLSMNWPTQLLTQIQISFIHLLLHSVEIIFYFEIGQKLSFQFCIIYVYVCVHTGCHRLDFYLDRRECSSWRENHGYCYRKYTFMIKITGLSSGFPQSWKIIGNPGQKIIMESHGIWPEIKKSWTKKWWKSHGISSLATWCMYNNLLIYKFCNGLPRLVA